MKYYVVSDIHGFYDCAVKALEEKGFFRDEGPCKLVVLGDLLDRGAQTVELQNFMAELVSKDKLIYIRGNHEDLLCQLADNTYKWFNADIVNTHHYKNGTVQALLSLAGISLQEALAATEKVAERAYNSVYFKTVLPRAVDYFETEKYVFVHGWLPCRASGFGGNAYHYEYDKNWRNAGKEDWYFARWYNGMRAYMQGVREPKKTVVCGHWHASYGHSVIEKKGPEFGEGADFTPFIKRGIIALDACTAVSGFVNCIVLED